jgi:flagellar hook-associated protein 1 FlgK
MANFSIGLTGLNAATTALEVVGNNTANASTKGYHRQRVELTPASYSGAGANSAGAGVNVAGVTRLVDKLLEAEILSQECSYAQISQELSVMTTVETAFGEFTEGSGLNATIDKFFDALEGLAAHPLERVYRNDVISSAQVLCSEFKRLGSSLSTLSDELVLETQNTTDSINSLVSQIAELNGKIQIVEIGQGQANNLRDQRDQLIRDLSQLVSVDTQERDYGVVDVSIAGLPAVTGTITIKIQAGLQDDGSLGVWPTGGKGGLLDITGGRLGALVSLRNELIANVSAELDTLAQAIIANVNQVQVQGLGVSGSFSELTGWTIGASDMSSLNTQVTDGTFYIRVTNTTTGDVERYAIDVDVSGTPPDTPQTIAAKINALPGVNASILSSQLHLVADAGHTFDFMPAVLPEPTDTNFTAASPATVSVSGVYNGNVNGTLTYTIEGTGSVGNGILRLNVTDDSGELISTLNIGQGYAAGDSLKLNNGVVVALGTGQFNDGDSFEVDVFASSDTSGFLAGAGMNAFFSGASASEMMVCSDMVKTPDRIATAFGSDLTDNTAALKLAAIQDQKTDSLGGMTAGEYYHRLVANVGQEVGLRESRQENIEAMLQNLENQRSEISSVDVNDEAALLMIFERMFQAMAKYLTTLQSTLDMLMKIV